jgi:pimeloyl-ACP methyl ester carboxylesterase
VGLAAALAGRGLAQEPPERMDAVLLQPHLHDIGGGRRLNLRCVGSGEPTIVFEQGGEGFISNWARVQPALSKLSRTCFYDRAGFGYSDPPDRPVTALSVTDDLRALLQRAGVDGPVVLVGHSVGGFYATMYANRFPGEVAGLVLVDAGFSGQEPPFAPERRVVEHANNRRGEGYLVRCAALARAGRLTPDNLAQNRCVAVPPDSTPEEARYVLHAITGPHWYEAELSQSVNYFTGDDEPSVSHQQEMDARRSFGEMPMVVLSRGRLEGAPWRTVAENRLAQQHWRDGHKRLAARSARSRWSIVPDAGHFIQKDKPEVVIEAVREVVEAVRRSGQNR